MTLRIVLLLSIFLNLHASTNLNEKTLKKIDNYIQTIKDKANIPTIDVGIVHLDKLVYKKSYTQNKTLSIDSLFFIGSLTKSFTALAIMQLVEQGKIKLDDPVKKHLPWFEIKDQELTKEITIKTLLNQTSGFSTYEGLKNFHNFDTDTMVLENTIKDLKDVSLHTKPSESFTYSNINYQILGLIIEKVSGESYEQFLQKNIFNKLSMKNTHASMDNINNNTLAKGHFLWFNQAIQKQYPFHTSLLPAGYIISNVEDMSKYLIAHINGNEKLLNYENLKQLHTPSATLVKDKIHYSYGWFVDTSNDETYLNHFGGAPGYSASMIIFPERKLGLIVLSNVTSYTLGSKEINNLAGGIIDIIDGKAAKKSQPDFISIGAYIFFIALILLQIYLLKRSRKKLKNIATYKFLIISIVFNLLIFILLYFVIPRIYHLTFSGFIMFVPDLGYMMMLSIIIAIFSILIHTYLGKKAIKSIQT